MPKLPNLVYVVQFECIDGFIEECQYYRHSDALAHFNLFTPADADVYKSVRLWTYDYATKITRLLETLNLSA